MDHGQTPMEPTRCAQRLQEWMWSQRPPLNNDRMAYKLGVSVQAVWNWLNRPDVPEPGMLARIAHYTRIPLAELYELAGIPVPEPVRPADDAERRDKTIAQVVASMREMGYGEDTVQQIVAHTRDRQFGTNRVHYVRAEFSPPDEFK
jgi:transcriptional regulator with XRE-family HTH domain